MTVNLISWTKRPIDTIAKAASVCYDSKPSLKIVEGCLKTGHCYDKDTQVLTDKGFVYWSEVDYETNLAVINPEDRTFKGFEKPIALIQYPYKGQMIHFNSRDVDLMITPEHNLYCSLSSTAYKRIHPEFELIAANKIVGNLDTNKKPVYKKPLRLALTARNTDTTIGDYIYKLYGFFIGDGYSTGKGNFISFHLKKERKIQYLKQICEECGLEMVEKSYNKYDVYTDPKIFRELFYNENKEKTFPLSFLTLSKESFEYFFEGLVNSDGNIYATGINYGTTSFELKERLSALFSINNTNFTVTRKKSRNENQKDLYVFIISNNKNKYPMFNDSRQKKYPTEEDYNDMVYCAQVSTGLLVVRRNDKVCLCGNCSVLEHCYFTFKIEGVSRSLLAQITRHRIASFSVQSQRYVKLTEPTYVEPNLTEVGKQVFEKSMERAWADYNALLESGSAPDESRSVLPNACTTTIVMTINIRSFMNFCNERLCSRASAEIRECANKMKNAVLNCPDISEEEAEILKQYFVPKCEKGKVKFCPEKESCGRQPSAKELNEIISALNEIVSAKNKGD